MRGARNSKLFSKEKCLTPQKATLRDSCFVCSVGACACIDVRDHGVEGFVLISRHGVERAHLMELNGACLGSSREISPQKRSGQNGRGIKVPK